MNRISAGPGNAWQNNKQGKPGPVATAALCADCGENRTREETVL